MAHFYSPRIVTDGLVLCLDAKNKNSYSGTGGMWQDISGYNYNFNTGVVTFNNEGWFYNPPSTGTGTSSQQTLSLGASAITVGAWVRVYTHGNWNDFVINNWVNSGWLLFGSSTQWYFGIGQNTVQFNASVVHLSTNSWTHLVGTYDGNRVCLYVNGELTSINTPLTSNFILDTNKTIRVGNSNDFGYDISQVTIYNRALSQSEILQNFNVIKSRFSL